MSFKIFEPAYTFIDDRLEVFLHDRASDILSQVEGPLRVAVVLYVVLYGIAIIRGAIAEPMIDFAIRGMKLAILFALATTVAYSNFVTEPLFRVLPETLARAISGSDVPNIGAAFDQFFSRAAYLGEKVGQQATPVNIAPVIEQAAVVLIGAVAAALGFGIVTVAKVALALLVALGPIFVGCALFETTRRFFFGWLSQCVNYLVLFALIITLFQLVLALVTSQWATIDGQDAMAGGLLFIALCVLGGIFFLQVPSLAAGIAGGASTGVADFFAAASFATRQSRAANAQGPSAGASRPDSQRGGTIRTARTSA
ncbi:type IV secretion system protein [Phenylobacterium sp. LjRoot219]|uniref:type IV secretion system protein n=1 Tax=Phenylobacterium sp. LjRoot219 TaxID=3342283 RepID=UPI003ECC60F3